jgi:2-polyprenyl-6-methoxyphenol hydroxylase-like FAD-dependent oxidoreductase
VPKLHAVVIAGGGPTGLMLAGELALAGVDVAIVERRATQDLVGSRAGGLHARTIEILDQRRIADRFISQGQVHSVAHFHVPLGGAFGERSWHYQPHAHEPFALRIARRATHVGMSHIVVACRFKS